MTRLILFLCFFTLPMVGQTQSIPDTTTKYGWVAVKIDSVFYSGDTTAYYKPDEWDCIGLSFMPTARQTHRNRTVAIGVFEWTVCSRCFRLTRSEFTKVRREIPNPFREAFRRVK